MVLSNKVKTVGSYLLIGLAGVFIWDKYLVQTDPIMKALSDITAMLYLVFAVLILK